MPIADEFWKTSDIGAIEPETDAEKLMRVTAAWANSLGEAAKLDMELSETRKREAYYRNETRALRSSITAEKQRLSDVIEMARFNKTSHESPFIRQHNAISKMVADLLSEPPGPGQALVRFLAATLDMELPDKWLASQE